MRHTDGVDFKAAMQSAIDTFAHYWHPMNIATICDPVDLWLPRQGYSEMRTKGMNAIRDYALLMKFDDHELLATEYEFQVPIDGTYDELTEAPHVLAGTIDRLAVRHYSRKPALCVDDYKSGKEYRYLRQNLQFTAYCYATTKREFWTGWRGEDGFGAVARNPAAQRFASRPGAAPGSTCAPSSSRTPAGADHTTTPASPWPWSKSSPP
jgi:hypothetical protein